MSGGGLALGQIPMKYQTKVAGLMQVGSLLLDSGISPTQLLQKLDLPPTLLLDPELWLDHELSFRLGGELSRVTGDRFAGLHVGERQKFERLGGWGTAVLSATCVQDALATAERQIGLIDTGLRVGLDQTETNARLWFTYLGRLGADPLQHVEANFMVFQGILDLAVEPIAATVCLPHARPKDTDEMERLLGPNLEFEADRAELVFDRAALQQPLRPMTMIPCTGSPKLPPGTPNETACAVMHFMKQLIEFERPTASAVADLVCLNLRTMQRHLSVYGVCFEDMLCAYRRRKALEYLSRGNHTITEIAFQLGYSDSAHFTRAFRRWTGTCPRLASARMQNLRVIPGSPAANLNISGTDNLPRPAHDVAHAR
jgi:AraC-like DNA-binding protein